MNFFQSIASFFKNLFGKKPVVAPIPAAPAAPVAPIVIPVLSPVISAPVSPKKPNPTEGSMGLGATDPNYIDPRFPNGVQGLTTDPSFNPGKTVLDVLVDQGKLFEPGPNTTYTITGPARIQVGIDGTQVVGETISYSIDGADFQQSIGTGFVGAVGAGQHTLAVRHNATVGRAHVEINPA